MWGRNAPKGEVQVQNTHSIINYLCEDLMEMETTPEPANCLGVMNGTQLSDRSIGTAPHAPLHTFLSSGNDKAQTAHDITHTQAEVFYP